MKFDAGLGTVHVELPINTGIFGICLSKCRLFACNAGLLVVGLDCRVFSSAMTLLNFLLISDFLVFAYQNVGLFPPIADFV